MSKLVKVTLIILAVLLLSFGVYLGILLCNYTVPILMYHYVNDEEPLRSKLGVSVAGFEKQMRFLKEHRYNVVTLNELVDLLQAKKKIPLKTVAITFDDGYLDNYINAYPILKKLKLPAAIFVVVNRIGKRLGNDEYMTWPQIQEMADSGLITIGSHSMNHLNLSEVDSEEKLRYEIFESKKILEEKLKKKIDGSTTLRIDFFSYPFGGVNPKTRSLVIEAGYKAGAGTNFPKGYPNNDIYALKRLRISENAKNLFIFWVESSGFYTFIKENRDDY